MRIIISSVIIIAVVVLLSIIVSNTLAFLPSKEDLIKLYQNGTSYDKYFKKSLELNQTRQPLNESAVSDGVNMCMSSIGRALIGALNCDYNLSLAYEACQAIPERIPSICIPSALKNYLKRENISDGQTDKLAWLYLINNHR